MEADPFVQREESRWLELDPRDPGTIVTWRFPAGFSPWDWDGSRVLGVQVDDLGVERVRILEEGAP